MEVEQQLEKRMEEVKGMGEKQEGKVNYYDTKLHTIIATYFVWERVFFFGISKKTFPSSISTLSCNGNWWVILALSCLCSFVYMLLFLDAALMLYREESEFNLIFQKHAQFYQKLLTIKQEAYTKDSSMEAGDQSSNGLWLKEEMMPINTNATYKRRPRERKLYFYTIFCALVSVASLELYACKSVLCT